MFNAINGNKYTEKTVKKRVNPDKFFQNNFSRTPGQNIDVLVKKAQPGRPTRKPGAFNNSGEYEFITRVHLIQYKTRTSLQLRIFGLLYKK